MSDHETSEWQVIDHSNDRIVPEDSRSDAESTVNEFSNQLELDICRPGEDPDTMLEQGPTEETETPDVDVVKHNEDGTTEPVQETEDEDPEPPADPDVIETEPVQEDNTPKKQEQGTPEFANYSSLKDPLESLPGWMKTQVSYADRGDSSTTINKRGCQVIAEYLGLEVETEALTRAEETDFDYATFKATVEKPDGRTFTGYGTARSTDSDQGDGSGWKLNMMSETRAFKRCVKAATGGGIEAFAKEQEEEQA